MIEREKLLASIDSSGKDLQQLLRRVEAHIEELYMRRGSDPDLVGLSLAEPDYWVELARQQLKLGLMALRRAVERPETF